MKKNILLLVFILLTTFTFAQVSIGAKAGVNYAYFPTIDDGVVLNSIHQPILASQIGAIAEFELSERFALSTELLYSIKGSEVNQQFTIFTIDQTFAAAYISIPISAKVKLGKFGILGGVEPSILTSERLKFNDSPWQPSNGLFNSFDFSLIGGVDFRIKKLYFAARYIHGLIDALEINFTDENGQPLGNGQNQNRVFQLSVGYFFLN